MGSRFEDTQWHLIQAARDGDAGARPALESLCRAYRAPVLAYVRRSGHTDSDAEDLTQAFFVHFLERGWYAKADPLHGRFRSLLLTTLRRFLIDQHHHGRAQKRHAPMAGADAMEQLADDGQTPEEAFTRAWLGSMVDHAMARLRDEWELAGKREQFERLAPLLFEHADGDELKALAEASGARSNTVAVQAHRLRQRLRRLVWLEMLRTVGSAEALEEELGELRGIARQASPR